MIDIVVSPGGRHFTREGYARPYNLFSRMAADDIAVDCFVGEVDETVDCSEIPSNVSVTPVNGRSNIQYLQRAYRRADQQIADADIYHHPNVSFREFNPLELTNRLDDVPFLLGPAEGGHDIPPEEIKMVIDRLTGVDLPQWTTDLIYQSIRPGLDHLINPLRERLFNSMLDAADQIVVVHQDAYDTYARYTDRSKIEIVPYGVDLEEYEFHERRDTTELLTVGWLIHRKGHTFLLDALKRIRESVPDVHLHIVGDGPMKDELVAHSERAGVSDIVTFHGRVSQAELLKRLRHARAFVHPSLSEGFSHVRLEAMASGCPVIGTNVNGAHDITRDGVDGHIVPTADPGSLADATTDVLTDLEKAQGMGRNAREKVERDNDWSDIAAEYAGLYRTMATE